MFIVWGKYSMNSLDILSQELIDIWTKILEDEKDFKPTIKTILEGHIKMKDLDSMLKVIIRS